MEDKPIIINDEEEPVKDDKKETNIVFSGDTVIKKTKTKNEAIELALKREIESLKKEIAIRDKTIEELRAKLDEPVILSDRDVTTQYMGRPLTAAEAMVLARKKGVL